MSAVLRAKNKYIKLLEITHTEDLTLALTHCQVLILSAVIFRAAQ